jgi:putative ABC transport system permease protein
MSSRTPLAWKNLTHDLRRLAVAVAGVGFAVVLIFTELGFLNALLESTVQVLRKLNGEVFLVSSAKYALPAMERFDLARVEQAKGLPGVKAVYPFYMENLAAVLRARQARGYPIRVLAFRVGDDVMKLDSLAALGDELRRSGTALADEACRAKFGIPRRDRDLSAYEGELANQEIHLIGHFRLGVDFVNDGNLIMSAANFARFFPNRAAGSDPLNQVDLGVVKLEDHADPLVVKNELRQLLPSDVEPLTKDELIEREMSFWRRNAPIGFIFLVGVYVGFVVGVVICYQIIYSDIADHMGEFATLKAMGYTDRYFLKLILRQSFYLSIMGFLPGLLLSYAGYAFLTWFTGLTMALTVNVVVCVLAVTITMCVVSGILALRKLMSVDPAELF